MTALDLPLDGEAAWGNKLRAAMNTTINVADLALSTANQAVSGSASTGVVQLDSFAGANDDAKLTAALNYAAAQTMIPAIQFPARLVTLATTRVPFSGMKIIGPTGASGPKNLELSLGKFVNHKVQLNVGNGTSSWFNGSGSLYDIYVADLACQGAGAGTSQFWHQPTGTLYASEFSALNLYGFKHAFGTPTAPCLITAVVFSGVWEVLTGYDTQFTLGGSDSQLWMGGQINLQNRQTGGAPDGTYQMILSTLAKTNIGYVYLTSSGNTRGLWIKSTDPVRLLRFFGGSYEGYNSGNLNHGCNIRIDSGVVRMYAPWLAHGMGAPLAGEQGIIQVNGGNVLLDGMAYDRSSTANSVPLVYHTGGRCVIREVASGTTVPSPVAETANVHTTGAGTFLADSSVNVI